MKLSLIIGALTVVIATMSSSTFASDKVPTDAMIDAAIKISERDTLLAPIQSRSALYSYQQATPAGQNPLSKLSDSGRQRFLDSLVFTENGLGGFNYSDLESELSATEIYKILSLFGVQRTTTLIKGAKILDKTDKAIMTAPSLRMEDHDNYRCSARATCSMSAHDICTSNC